MTTKDKIQYGRLTLSELTDIIQIVEMNNKELGLRLWWVHETGKLLAYMADGDRLIYEKIFSNEPLHIMLAKMYYNCQLIVGKRSYKRKLDEERQAMIEREYLGGQNAPVFDIDPDENRMTMGQRAEQIRKNKN